MTSISKTVYIDKLDDKVNEYNKTHHKTIKMKPTYVNISLTLKLKIMIKVRNLNLVIM